MFGRVFLCQNLEERQVAWRKQVEFTAGGSLIKECIPHIIGKRVAEKIDILPLKGMLLGVDPILIRQTQPVAFGEKLLCIGYVQDVKSLLYNNRLLLQQMRFIECCI